MTSSPPSSADLSILYLVELHSFVFPLMVDMGFSRRIGQAAVAVVVALATAATAQTWSSCNPLYSCKYLVTSQTSPRAGQSVVFPARRRSVSLTW